MQHEAPGRVGLDHVRVRPVVPAEGEAARRGVRRPRGTDLAGVLLDVGGVAEPAVGQDRQHRDGAAEVVGDQHETSRRVDADVGRAGAAGADGVQQLQLPVRPIDREGADRPFLLLADPVGLVRGVQAGAGGVQRQAARARSQLMDAGRRQRPGGAVHVEEVNAAAVAGRQVHLRRQHVAERRAEGADVGHERTGDPAWLRMERTIGENRRSRERRGGPQERASGVVEGSHRHASRSRRAIGQSRSGRFPCVVVHGAPGETRTPNPQVRSLML